MLFNVALSNELEDSDEVDEELDEYDLNFICDDWGETSVFVTEESIRAELDDASDLIEFEFGELFDDDSLSSTFFSSFFSKNFCSDLKFIFLNGAWLKMFELPKK